MSSRSEDDLKVPSQRSDEARRADEDRDHANDVHDIGRADDDYSGRADDDGYGGVREGDALVRDPDDRLVAGDRTADDEPPRDGTVYDEHARDAVPGDALTPDTTDDDLARDRTMDDDVTERDPVAYTPATHGHTPVVPTDTGDEDNDESPYKDPYATTGGPDPAPTGVLADDVPAGEVPSHAAPQEVALFDQDPAEVQGRWRDLQASFVDDPGEAVQRADGLVGEVVESLTNSLTSRTNTLRERWKDVDSPDTEDLRQALRDYRNVLERLLALSTQETRR